jgi:hypothetical protein
MSEQSAAPSSGLFSIPTNWHDFTALVAAVLSVFVLIQFGAPLVREIEFLDPKLREFFIGISFVAFPSILRGYKRGLAGVKLNAPRHHDLAPWYVVSGMAAALLFAWNQFVGFSPASRSTMCSANST